MVNEKEIIEKAKRNMQDFAPLYSHYHKQILLFIYQRVNTKEEASDLTSQTFLKAMKSIAKYEDKGFSFGAWLYKIALNEVNTYYRKNSKVINITDGILGTLFYELKEEKDTSKQQKLMRVIKELKHNYFQYIEMRFFENRPFKEIAEILGVTESNAKITTYRALDKLKALMS